jgi:Outer membrane protein beta-barrel domain
MFFKYLLMCGLLSAPVSAYQYAGADVQLRNIKSHRVWDEKVFSTNLPQANVFIGHKLTDFIALEAGVTLGKSQKHIAKINKQRNKLKVCSFHVGVMGMYPLNSKLDVIAGLGLARIHARVIKVELAKYTGDSITTELKKFKTVPRISLGAHYALTGSLSFRIIGTFEGTARLRVDENKFKNSITLGVGALCSF